MTAMDFRQYDNAIGRFVARDPLAELSYSQTPYHFANNNSINFSDPSGLFATKNAAEEFMRILNITNASISYNPDRQYWEASINGVSVWETDKGNYMIGYADSTGITYINCGGGGGGSSSVSAWFSNNSSNGGGGDNSGSNSGFNNFGGGGNSSTTNSPRTNVAKNTPKPVKESRFGGEKVVKHIKKLRTSDRGIKFILSYEKGPFGNGKPALKPYDAKDGKLTIGWGHVILNAESLLLRGITMNQANQIFVNDLSIRESTVNKLVKVSLTQNQFDALVSYYFNTGSLANTRLLRYLNSGDYMKAAGEMDIITSQGEVMRGLINRRESEQNIFLNNTYRNHN